MRVERARRGCSNRLVSSVAALRNFDRVLVEVVADVRQFFCEVDITGLVLVNESFRGRVLCRQTDESDVAARRRLGSAVASAHRHRVSRETSHLFAVLHLLRLQRLLDLAVS